MKDHSFFSIIDAPQRSDEWFAARAGCLTGSVASDMVATIKNGEAAARRDLRFKLAIERLTGKASEGPDLSRNKDVQRGVELEPFARMALEEMTGLVIEETGFLRLVDIAAGCSLDGHANGFDTIVEFKCPRPANHIDTVMSNEVPSHYVPQILHNLWVTGAKRALFLSYCPDLPGKLGSHLIEVKADLKAIGAYAEKATKFLTEVDALHTQLKARM